MSAAGKPARDSGEKKVTEASGLAPNDTAAGEPGAGTALAVARWTPARPVTASAVTESAGLQRSERSERSRQAACYRTRPSLAVKSGSQA